MIETRTEMDNDYDIRLSSTKRCPNAVSSSIVSFIAEFS